MGCLGGGDLLWILILGESCIGLAIGGIRTEASVLDHDGGPFELDDVLEGLDRRFGCCSASLLRLCQQRPAALFIYGEWIISLGKTTSFFSRLDIETVATIEDSNFFTFGGGATDTTLFQLQQLNRNLGGDILRLHVLQERSKLGFLFRLGISALDIRAEAAALDEDRLTGGTALPDRFILASSRFHDLAHLIEVEIIGAQFLGNVASHLACFEVGAVSTDPENDFQVTELPWISGSEGHREAADLGRVDGFEAGLEESFESFRSIARPEGFQVLLTISLSPGDLVEVVFHLFGETVFDDVSEVLLHQAHHGKGGPGRDQCLVLAKGVGRRLDPVDDRGIGTGATDAAFFHLLDQPRLGVASNRLGSVLLWIQFCYLDTITHSHRGEDGLLGASGIDLEESRIVDHGASRLIACRIGMLFLDLDDDGSAGRRFHLGSHGSLPDQVVEAPLILTDLFRNFFRIDEVSRANRFMFTAGTLRKGMEVPWCMFIRPEALLDQVLDRLHRFRGEHVVVGADVGDEALLKQRASRAHRPGRGISEPITRFLLESTGDERYRWFTRVVLLFE